MKYITIKNLAGSPSRWFAETETEAQQMALNHGCVRNLNNGKIVQAIDVDQALFPHKGQASLRLMPERIYLASTHDLETGEWTTLEQNSDDLHATQ